MKKLIILCSLMSAFSAYASTSTLEKNLMLDYVGTDMDHVFEIKTAKYDKVTLDCQSFIQGMTFSNKNEVKHNFYIDSYECQGAHDFIQQAKDNKVNLCLVIEDKSLSFEEVENASECQ